MKAKFFNIYSILILGLLVRLIFWVVFPHPIFDDATHYREMGVNLFHGSNLNTEYMPLYPILTYLTGGGVGQYFLDIVFSTLTIFLIYKISLALFSEVKVALLAAFIASFYPYFIFYAISGLTETSNIFFLCLTFYLFYSKRYGWGMFAAILAIYIRPTTDLITPILLIFFILVVHQQGWRVLVRNLLWYGILYSLMLSPWWVYNYHRFGTFVRLDLNLGQVLYSGNNPMNHTGGGILGVDVDEDEFNHQYPDPVVRDAKFKMAALDYIKNHSWHVIKLDLDEKMIRFWRLWPYAPGYHNWLMTTASILSYGVMLFFAIIYFLSYGYRDWRKISPIIVFSIYLTSIYLVTIASGRYRLPIEPFIIILGSYALYQSKSFMRNISTRQVRYNSNSP